MIRRFRPYFSYLRPQRGLLIVAILCGIIAGVASGAGLPLMIDQVFPVIFSGSAHVLSGWQLAAVMLPDSGFLAQARENKIRVLVEHKDAGECRAWVEKFSSVIREEIG